MFAHREFFMWDLKVMDGENRGVGKSLQFLSGWEMKCQRCGDILPLLHPHIVVERYDEQENMICERCYESLCSES
jgi:hypothetical protein